MANATQQYNPNVNFQLSTVNQLTAFDKNEYSWVGRTLTSWTNELCGTLPLDAIVKFSNAQQNVSANWELNKYPINVSIAKDYGAGSGKVVMTTSCDEPPLASPVLNVVELSDRQNGQVIFNSLLSIDLVPDDGYKATKLTINGYNVNPSAQWVYVDANNDNKTSSASFDISATFTYNQTIEEPTIALKLEDGQSIGVDSDEVTQGTIGSYRNEIIKAIIGDDIENDYN